VILHFHTFSLSPVDFKLEIPDSGGKDDVWAFGSPGVGFGLLGVWCTRPWQGGIQAAAIKVLLDAGECTF
jgi:hypothetical protein